jgi:hypothetical protein
MTTDVTYIQIGDVVIPDAIHNMSQELGEPISEGIADEVAEEVAVRYRGAIEAVDAIDSGRFHNNVHARAAVRTGEFYERTVISEDEEGPIPYSDVIERGWINRARGQASYPGRYPAMKAVDNLQPVVDESLIHQLERYGPRTL